MSDNALPDFRPFWEQREPDFINEIGSKWWKDEFTTAYAHRKNLHGISLPDITAWIVQDAAGERIERILLRAGKPIYATPSLEDIAIRIDILKRLAQDD